MAQVLSEMLGTVRVAYAAKNHEVQLEVSEKPLFVEGDPVRLAQLIANLLHNAHKYTPEGGTIHVSAQRAGGDLVIRVKDSGVGISSQMLPRIFDLFTQEASSLHNAAGGLGIGLSLARIIAEMHGGSIQKMSEGHGRGSEFILRLPALPPASAQETRTSRQAAADASPDAPNLERRILIVEDNQDAARTLAKLLRLRGHSVQITHDCEAALQAGDAFAPDVVLLDIGLPGLNGFEACRELRTRSWGRNALVVAMTGWGTDEDRRKSKAAGFDLHLVKPVDFAELVPVLALGGNVEQSAV